MSGTNVVLVNEQLNVVKSSSAPEKGAYEGALLMKKAGLVPNAMDKLSLFKEGKLKLEEALAHDGTNAEYHFLRLIIQENAPKILRYNNEVEKDCQYIRTHFKGLPVVLQRVIVDYSRKSKALGPMTL
jgi:hypothetical protein